MNALTRSYALLMSERWRASAGALLGIVTQSDMLAALYKRIAVSDAAPRA